MSDVIPGIDVYLESLGGGSRGGKVGLLANVASLTRDGCTTLAALRAAGANVTVVFAPEHGYFGLGRAGENMANSQVDGLPIASLYGESFGPPADLLRPPSAVLVDLQDTGNRWYTYLGTVANLLQVCARTGTPVIVLDRPNPQGGDVVEGPLAEPAYFSLVAPAAMPARYGLTIGESALMINREIGAALGVVPVAGWRRDMIYADTGWLWSSPSPAIPRAETCFFYTGTCLIEGTNISEGRGTTLPFEQIGAPFVEAEPLAAALNRLELPGVVFTPAWFRPSASKYAGEACQGVRLHAVNLRAVRGFSLGLHLLITLRELYPSGFQWAIDSMQGNPVIDRLVGTQRLRIALEQGESAADILDWCDRDSARFKEESRGLWLYI